MRVLLTGANGLLGSNLTRSLLNDGHAVRTMVRSTSDTRGLDGLKIEPQIGDVRNRDEVRAAVDGCEVVFHAAAVFSYWGYSRSEMMDTARDGTGIMLEACRDAKVKRLVLTSSTAVFGGNDTNSPLNETAPLIEDTGPDYFRSKALQERIAIEMARELSVEIIIVNPSLILGPHDYKPSQSSQTFTSFLRDPLKMTFPGGICLVHAEDVAKGHLLALEHGTPYERHVVGGENLLWSDFHTMLATMTDTAGPRLRLNRPLATAGAWAMELIASMTRKPPLATQALARQVGRFFWYSSDKMRALGYAPRSAKSVLRDTLAWWITSPNVSKRERDAWQPQL